MTLTNGSQAIEPPDIQTAIKDIMSNFAASVTVVTSRSEGRDHGLTVSAFTSVSLEPPLILVCVEYSSHSLAAMRAASGFTVNMLREGMGDLAMTFASKDEDKFSGISTIEPVFEGAGLALPEASFAILECQTMEVIEAGDHAVFLGQVQHASRVDPGAPLMYWRRRFGRISVD